MPEKFEKKLKKALPYIIIIAVIYLFLPALLINRQDFLNDVILIGVLPLTALICCLVYSCKIRNDFFVCLIAPVIFIPAMFLYGIFISNPVICIIYLVSCFICGLIGLMVGDIINPKKKDEKEEKDERRKRPVRRDEDFDYDEKTEERPRREKRAQRVPRRERKEREEVIEEEVEEDVFEDKYAFSDQSTTEDDIDAILAEIHKRKY